MPRRAKKITTHKPDSDSEHGAPTESLTSKVLSELKPLTGLKSKGTESTKKRKRASSVVDDGGKDEPPAPIPGPAKRARAKRSTSATREEVSRMQESQSRARKLRSAEHDDTDEEPAPTSKQEVAEPPRAKASPRKSILVVELTQPAPKRTQKSTAKDNSPSSESEDELAIAPVSPVKPRRKVGTKSTATTPLKSAPTPVRRSPRKAVSRDTRKTSKPQDEYDSSIRELRHSPGSATLSETSESHGSKDYDPVADELKHRLESTEEEEEVALENMEVDSEALDDESDFGPHKIAERASASPVKGQPARTEKDTKSARYPSRKSIGKRVKEESSEEEYESDKSGQVVVGKIVKAPVTGRVPPGQISQNTFNFLMNLQDPAKNDREWFKLHEPVFRLAEKEWIAFVDAFITTLVEVDDEIPPLPPKDVIHRIYRDVRFSNDKTPYKPNFSASSSRSGRKGIFAGYHISIKPGGGSLVAAGTWCPGKDEIHSIRNVIKRNHGRHLREVLAEPSFVKYFGPPKPLATKGQERQRQSIFGAEDELKVAPAGVKKDHPDIDLLKCRSFAVIHKFTDAQVLKRDFLETVLKPVLVEMKPLVHCLNDYMTLPLDDMSEGSDPGSDEE